MAPIIAGAVTWQMDSSPFGFPAESVKNPAQSNAMLTAHLCRPVVNNGFVTIQYSLPQNVRGATLTIYNLFGARIQTFDLTPGSNAVRWGVSSHRVVTGVYLAAMRYGTNEEKTKISIVK
ncbi:MAG TPA: T9SS type A sorting domain-containing protein [Chitinivibrionales bacterium]|nr:T9SS type A sorting domain-containing protein [Chitinivibrionales bacterium]